MTSLQWAYIVIGILALGYLSVQFFLYYKRLEAQVKALTDLVRYQEVALGSLQKNTRTELDGIRDLLYPSNEGSSERYSWSDVRAYMPTLVAGNEQVTLNIRDLYGPVRERRRDSVDLAARVEALEKEHKSRKSVKVGDTGNKRRVKVNGSIPSN